MGDSNEMNDYLHINGGSLHAISSVETPPIYNIGFPYFEQATFDDLIEVQFKDIIEEDGQLQNISNFGEAAMEEDVIIKQEGIEEESAGNSYSTFNTTLMSCTTQQQQQQKKARQQQQQFKNITGAIPKIPVKGKTSRKSSAKTANITHGANTDRKTRKQKPYNKRCESSTSSNQPNNYNINNSNSSSFTSANSNCNTSSNNYSHISNSHIRKSPIQTVNSNNQININYENNLNYLNFDNNITNACTITTNSNHNNSNINSSLNIAVNQSLCQLTSEDPQANDKTEEDRITESLWQEILQILEKRKGSGAGIKFGSSSVPIYSPTPYSDATKTKKQPIGHIKRPMNAFIVWSQMMRKTMTYRGQRMHNAVISKELGEIWKTMSEDDKIPYVEESNIIKIFHKIEYPQYRYKPKKKSAKESSMPTENETVNKETKRRRKPTKTSNNIVEPIKSQNYLSNDLSPPIRTASQNSTKPVTLNRGDHDAFAANMSTLQNLESLEIGSSYLNATTGANDYNTITSNIIYATEVPDADLNITFPMPQDTLPVSKVMNFENSMDIKDDDDMPSVATMLQTAVSTANSITADLSVYADGNGGSRILNNDANLHSASQRCSNVKYPGLTNSHLMSPTITARGIHKAFFTASVPYTNCQNHSGGSSSNESTQNQNEQSSATNIAIIQHAHQNPGHQLQIQHHSNQLGNGDRTNDSPIFSIPSNQTVTMNIEVSDNIINDEIMPFHMVDNITAAASSTSIPHVTSIPSSSAEDYCEFNQPSAAHDSANISFSGLPSFTDLFNNDSMDLDAIMPEGLNHNDLDLTFDSSSLSSPSTLLYFSDNDLSPLPSNPSELNFWANSQIV